MSEVAITAQARFEFGKGAARKLRREGRIPAVIYGSGSELLHITLPEHELNLALRKPRVVLAVTFEGSTVITKPRDVQRDPVKRVLEHLDLVIISKLEAAARGSMAEAMKVAEAAAVEAGIDPGTVAAALQDAIARGEDPMAAALHAVADVRAQAEAYAAANAAQAEIDAAAAVAGAAAPAVEAAAEVPPSAPAPPATD
ncbi:MAG: 50S ribosomal protein L25 [Actinomycetota bacterium]|nr:50S ribosomal protein L25 [Actinomycetota bacterium]